MFEKYLYQNSFTMYADRDNKEQLITIKDVKKAIESIEFLGNKIYKMEIEFDNIAEEYTYHIYSSTLKGTLVKLGNTTIDIELGEDKVLKVKNINSEYSYNGFNNFENKIIKFEIIF